MIPGGWEWVIIILVIVVIFGAKRLPEIAKGLGQGIKSFKKEIRDDGETPKTEEPPKKSDGPAQM